MTTRELHFRIQERLENLAATAGQMSGEQPSQLEIDLLLSKLRETYDEVLYMKRIALQQFVKQAPRKPNQLKPITERQPEAMPLIDVEEPDPSVDDVLTVIESAIETTAKVAEEPVAVAAPSVLPEVSAAIESVQQLAPQTAAKPTEKQPPVATSTPEPAAEVQPKPQSEIQQTVTTAIQDAIKATASTAQEALPKTEKPAPKPEPKPEPKQQEASTPNKTVHEMLNNYQGAKIQPKAVKNLGTAIGLNDKFQFIRELFGSSSDTFTSTIDTLNKMNSFDEAHGFLKQHYNWDETDPVVVKFLEMVNRRYL